MNLNTQDYATCSEKEHPRKAEPENLKPRHATQSTFRLCRVSTFRLCRVSKSAPFSIKTGSKIVELCFSCTTSRLTGCSDLDTWCSFFWLAGIIFAHC